VQYNPILATLKVALLAYLSPFSNKIVLFIKSGNLYFENGAKCFNTVVSGATVPEKH